jgi:hypothetical protein
MERLLGQWKDKIEIDAKTLEHTGRSIYSARKRPRRHKQTNRRSIKKTPNERSQRMAKATENVALLWKQNPNASYKKIVDLADEHKFVVPWADCTSWSDAHAKRQSAVKSLLSKARNITKRRK